MSFARYALLVGVLVVLGLVTVWEHLRILAAGYQVNELRARRARLEEEARVLERRIDAVATPSAAAERVREMGLDLGPCSAGRGVASQGTPVSGGRGSAPRGSALTGGRGEARP